jgi:hypothetical protein
MMTATFVSCTILVWVVSCSTADQETEYLFRPITPEESGIEFANNLPLDDDLNILNFIYYFNGGGVAVGDINNDGLEDIFFTGNQVSNKLYLNQGNLKFKDITNIAGLASEGWSTGVSMVDINTDGLLDIYVCRSGHLDPERRKNLLYINQGNITFKEMADEYGLADTSYSTQSAFLDYDLDGDLDMYLLNHKHQMTGMNNPVPRKLNGESENTDRLYRNEGPGPFGHPVFINVSKDAGVTIEGFGLGVGVSDLNQDGYPDIYVSNDFISNDIMYINQKDGTFKDKSKEYLKHQSHNGMGNDIADINNDGLTDILVLDMLPSDNRRRKLMLNKPNYNLFEYSKSIGYQPQYMRNTFQLNNGVDLGKHLPFSEVGQLMGISSTDWSWGGLMADYDMDGRKDMFITTGYLKDMTDLDFIVYRRKQYKFRTREEADSLYLASINKLPEVKLQNHFYRNIGNLEFEDRSTTWTRSSPGFSNGAVYADLDNDGDLDIVTNNINEKATLLRNTSTESLNSEKHFLKLNFQGSQSNPNGMGTKVWVYSDSLTQFSENYTSRGFQSNVAPTLYFALDGVQMADSIVVQWPEGRKKSYYNVSLDTVVKLRYADAIEKPFAVSNDKNEKIFQILNGVIPFEQREIPFSDFDIEPLIPHKFSNNGPAIAVADVNGDELEDIFIGGSYTFSGQLYVQNPGGGFTQKELELDPEHEDVGAVWFDADNDGDNDLYVVSGGSEFSLMKPKYYQDRFYRNDGKGNFTLDEGALPDMNTSGSCVVAADYDDDGDLDLFVGGMVVPGSYGTMPRSYLLENRQGKFIDVTEARLKEKGPGMVSSALWTDVNNDGWIDLMVVGKWMPITIYVNQRGNFSKLTLKGSSGWWNSINGGDFDNDGDTDYIVGNLGRNTVYKATENYPIELYVGDFDKDGRIDPLMTQYSLSPDGSMQSYPVASRDLLAEQMIFIKRKFKDYRSYANVQMEDILSDSMEESPAKWDAKKLETSYIENMGEGKFRLKSLPVQAQWAPVLGTTITDVDMDGNLDAILVGNFFGYEVGYGRNDAFLGLVLMGDGMGNFHPKDQKKTGFIVDGDARALVRINGLEGELFVSSVNSDSLKVFQKKATTGVLISVLPQKESAIITLGSGKQRKIEFYRGEGYLSQSTRTLRLPQDARIEFDN